MRASLFIKILIFSFLLAGCEYERDQINLSGPNIIRKTMLDGTWYYHGRIVDTPATKPKESNSYGDSIVGTYQKPVRIKFEIEEDFLYVNRTRELLEGAGSGYGSDEDDYDSHSIVAAFKIKKHFDIVEVTNLSSGKSVNVIEENTDHPWYEREFIRVDWSYNHAGSWNSVFYPVVNTKESTPADMHLYLQSEDCTPALEFSDDLSKRCIPSDNAPFFDLTWDKDGTTLKHGYFDITSVQFRLPGYVEINGYNMPDCWLWSSFETEDCATEMYYARASFWKYDEDESDYQPLSYKGAITDQFGFFDESHIKYDHKSGLNNYSRETYATRHNTWEQTHIFDFDKTYVPSSNDDLPPLLENSKFNGLCKQDSDCSEAGDDGVFKSECDIYSELRSEDKNWVENTYNCKIILDGADLANPCPDLHYCTLPHDERRVRPIVYYTNPEWPEELIHHYTEPGIGDDEASRNAWKYAYADQPGEVRSMVEQISDQYNAAFTRVINILKTKAAGTFDTQLHANTPFLDDNMKRKEAGKGAFSSIGTVERNEMTGEILNNLGFDENWYDSERPAFTICRFSPVLGPDDDPDGIEPDICWERIQETSRCVIQPDKPGINPKTGTVWDEARTWPICTKREKSPRIGDVRYNMLYWVPRYYAGYQILGQGPPFSDEATGEILSGGALVYQLNDVMAGQMTDKVMLMLGEMDTSKYIDGYNLAGWYGKYTNPETNPAANMNTGFSLGRITSMGNMMVENQGPEGGKIDISSADLPGTGSTDLLPFSLDDLIRAGAAKYSADSHLDSEPMIKSISQNPTGGSMESALLGGNVGETVMVSNGINPLLYTDALSSEIADFLLITRTSPFAISEAKLKLQNWMTLNQTSCFNATGEDELTLSLVYEIQKLRADGYLPGSGDSDILSEALWRMLRKKSILQVSAHELGHTLGLRHQFAGSEDFLNYHEQYWNIRTHGCADIEYDNLAPDITSPGNTALWDEENGCDNDNPVVSPRFLAREKGKPWSGDPVSAYELYKNLMSYGNTSVMEYSNNYRDSGGGLGRYDWAALLYGYGNYLEVFNDGVVPTHDWELHQTMRPGTASADSTDNSTIIDENGNFTSNGTGITTGSIVTNLQTSEESYVTGFADSNTLEISPPFDSPFQKGDKYAVWGNPLGFDNENIPKINGWGIKKFLNMYMEEGESPAFFNANIVQPHYTEWYRQWTATIKNPQTGIYESKSPSAGGKPSLAFNRQNLRDVRHISRFNWKAKSVQEEENPGGYTFNPGFDCLDPKVTRVPYAYCTDSEADISGRCRKRDLGADDWERMHHHITNWDKWYVERSFIRGRIGYWTPFDDNIQDSLGIYSNWYKPVKDFNNKYQLFVDLFVDLYAGDKIEATTIDSWNSWGSWTMALHDGFNMLMQTIATPSADPWKSYSVKYRENGKMIIELNNLDMGNIGLDIAQGARVLETYYGNATNDDNCGNEIKNCIWNFGWYYDKIAALYALTSSETHFLARDTAMDIRTYRISFFDNFNWQIKKHFSAMMGNDWETWAPLTVAHKEPTVSFPVRSSFQPVFSSVIHPVLLWRDWANPALDIRKPAVYKKVLPSDVADALGDPDNIFKTSFVPLDPATEFTVKIYAMILAMARFQHNFDMSFYNMSRMWIKSGDTPETIDDDDIIKFYDPENKLIYQALAKYNTDDRLSVYKTDDNEQPGVAASIIIFANTIKSRSHDCDPLSTNIADVDPESGKRLGVQTPLILEDDCCDDPYDWDNYPISPEITDDCEMNYGDTALWTPGDDNYTAALEQREYQKTLADEHLKKHKGLLDFQVRLTNIYDEYVGLYSDNPWSP